MDAIRLWAVAVCAAAITAAVAQLAAPEGKIQKAMRCVIGLFFVCCVVSPFAQNLPLLSAANLSYDLPVSDQGTENLTGELNRQTADLFGDNVRQIVGEALAQKEIFPEEVTVNVHVGEDSNIYISSLVVRPKQEDAEKASQIIKVVQQATGITPEVLTKGGDIS